MFIQDVMHYAIQLEAMNMQYDQGNILKQIISVLKLKNRNFIVLMMIEMTLMRGN